MLPSRVYGLDPGFVGRCLKAKHSVLQGRRRKRLRLTVCLKLLGAIIPTLTLQYLLFCRVPINFIFGNKNRPKGRFW